MADSCTGRYYLLLARAGLRADIDHDLERLRPAFDQDVDSATHLEAVWLTISAWIERGDLAAAASAIEQLTLRSGAPPGDRARAGSDPHP